MSEDLTAIFQERLVRLLRVELAKEAGRSVEDLVGDDAAMEALARAIMSAPLAAEIRPNLTVVPAHEPRPLILPGEDQDPGGARMIPGQRDDTVVDCAREGCGHPRRRHVRFRGDDWGHCEVEGCGCPSFTDQPTDGGDRVITTAMLQEWAAEAEVGRDLPGWMKDALAQPQHDYDENGQVVEWEDDPYDAARRATDDVLGPGTYARMNERHPDPGVQRAIARFLAECPTCHGSKIDPKRLNRVPCPTCGGSGKADGA